MGLGVDWPGEGEGKGREASITLISNLPLPARALVSCYFREGEDLGEEENLWQSYSALTHRSPS
jgi:hypothetical protein